MFFILIFFNINTQGDLRRKKKEKIITFLLVWIETIHCLWRSAESLVYFGDTMNVLLHNSETWLIDFILFITFSCYCLFIYSGMKCLQQLDEHWFIKSTSSLAMHLVSFNFPIFFPFVCSLIIIMLFSMIVVFFLPFNLLNTEYSYLSFRLSLFII